MSYRGVSAVSSSRHYAARPPKLLEVRARLRLKHDSLRTEQASVYWICRYIRACGMRHPCELDGMAVEGFLTGLAVKDRVAASTQNQALSALLLLYRDVLAIDLPWMENVVRAKQPRRLPIVPFRAKVAILLNGMSGSGGGMATPRTRCAPGAAAQAGRPASGAGRRRCRRRGRA